MKLGVLIISGLLLLTGCGNASPSQIEIIEYEKCLELQQGFVEVYYSKDIENLDGLYDTSIWRDRIFEVIKPDPKTGLIQLLELSMKRCKAYRP